MKFNITKVTFKENKHQTSFYTKYKLTFLMMFKKQLKCKVYFNDDSKYDLKDVDQLDWLKIIGTSGSLLPKIRKISDFQIDKTNLFNQLTFSYFTNKPKKLEKIIKYIPVFLFEYTLVPSQHIDSKRLVYRYNIIENCFEISTSYVYNNLKRTNPSPEEIIKIYRNESGIYETPLIIIDKIKYYNLTPYFGGNEKAPTTNSFVIKII